MGFISPAEKETYSKGLVMNTLADNHNTYRVLRR